MIDPSTYSTFSRELEIPGYVLDEPSMRRIDQYLRTSLSRDSQGTPDIHMLCSVTTEDDSTLRFESLEEVFAHFATTKDLIKELRLEYFVRDAGRTEIFFDDDGKIRFTAYGPTRSAGFVAEGLTREIRNVDPKYHWAARLVAFSRAPQLWLTFLLGPVSFLLLAVISYYFYASHIGVNVDPTLLYEGNTYYQDVERAIKSKSVEEKLDILLKGQLKGFTNVSAVLARTQVQIGVLAVVLVGMVLLLVALRSYAHAYPRAFFAFGLAIEQLRRLERKREIWIVAVCLAFSINVAAGLLVAFVS